MTAIGELAGLGKSRLVQMVKALEKQLEDAHEAARAVAFAEAAAACRAYAHERREAASSRGANTITVDDHYAGGACKCATLIEELPLKPEDD